jgi:hypothetical protein
MRGHLHVTSILTPTEAQLGANGSLSSLDEIIKPINVTSRMKYESLPPEVQTHNILNNHLQFISPTIQDSSEKEKLRNVIKKCQNFTK